MVDVAAATAEHPPPDEKRPTSISDRPCHAGMLFNGERHATGQMSKRSCPDCLTRFAKHPFLVVPKSRIRFCSQKVGEMDSCRKIYIRWKVNDNQLFQVRPYTLLSGKDVTWLIVFKLEEEAAAADRLLGPILTTPTEDLSFRLCTQSKSFCPSQNFASCHIKTCKQHSKLAVKYMKKPHERPYPDDGAVMMHQDQMGEPSVDMGFRIVSAVPSDAHYVYCGPCGQPTPGPMIESHQQPYQAQYQPMNGNRMPPEVTYSGYTPNSSGGQHRSGEPAPVSQVGVGGDMSRFQQYPAPYAVAAPAQGHFRQVGAPMQQVPPGPNGYVASGGGEYGRPAPHSDQCYYYVRADGTQMQPACNGNVQYQGGGYPSGPGACNGGGMRHMEQHYQAPMGNPHLQDHRGGALQVLEQAAGSISPLNDGPPTVDEVNEFSDEGEPQSQHPYSEVLYINLQAHQQKHFQIHHPNDPSIRLSLNARKKGNLLRVKVEWQGDGMTQLPGPRDPTQAQPLVTTSPALGGERSNDLLVTKQEPPC